MPLSCCKLNVDQMSISKADIVAILLSILGLAISIYLTITHYFSSVPLVCSNTGIINCEGVLTSQYAVLFGIPVAIYGVIFFVIEIALLLIKKNEPLVIFNALSIGSVLYLVYIEYLLKEICEYCTAVHVLTVLLFIYALWKVRK